MTPTSEPNSPPSPEHRGVVDRLLSPFADVRGGEGVSALLMMLTAFLLLSAYYVIKPLREALILSGEGAEVKSYSSAVQALLLLMLVPAYGKLGSRGKRLRLITCGELFLVSPGDLFYLIGSVSTNCTGGKFVR